MSRSYNTKWDHGTESPALDLPPDLWVAGDYRVNREPVTKALGLYGWTCTAGGRPGSWIELRVIPGAGFTPAPDSYAVACVDYDGLLANGTTIGIGSDTTGRFGYAVSTGVPATDMATALTAAKLTPFKTFERVGQVMPRWGNDGFVVVLGAARTAGAAYRNMANAANQDFSWLNAAGGWKRVLLRGSTDFSNSASDKITAGFQTATGANAAGYNATAATVNVLTCQLNGGGAPGFPAESTGFSAISGKRVRFSPTTTTVALRNATSSVWKNTTTVLTLSEDLPATPVAGDVFYLEEPRLRFGAAAVSLGANTGVAMAGFAASSIALSGASVVQLAGVESDANISGAVMPSMLMQRTYTDEVGSTATIGSSGRAVSNVSMTSILSAVVNHAAALGNSAFNTYTNCPQLVLGTGSFLRSGFLVRSIGSAGPIALPTTARTFIGNGIGDGSVPTGRRLRITRNTINNSPGYLQGVGGGATIYGVDVSGDAVGTVHGCITIEGQNMGVTIDDVVSTDGGNAGYVVDVTASYGLTVVVGQIEPVTATATLGDVRLAGGAVGSIADLATSNVVDTHRNNILGAGGNVVADGLSFVNRT